MPETAPHTSAARGITHRIWPVLLVGAGLLLRLYHVEQPFISVQDSGMYPAFCRNLAEYGILRAWFLPIISFLDRPEMLWHHVAHPPLTHLCVALLFQHFGPSEVVYRLFNLFTGGLVMAVFLYLLARRWLGGRAALWALAFWAFIPSAAYFERVYTMSMQAYALGLGLYYFFLRRVEEPDGRWTLPLYLVCVVGPLVDWQFDFAFGGLLLFCLVRRGPWRLWWRVTLLSAGVTLAYFAYSALVRSYPPLSPQSDHGLAFWISYALDRLNPFQVLSWDYLRRLAEVCGLHFTVAGWLVPGLWLAGLLGRSGNRGFSWRLWLPVMCMVPGMAYLVLVPYDTWNHVWTPYGLMPAAALAFGVGVDRLLARGRWWPRVLLAGVVGVLVLLAAPTLNLLHRPFAYLVGNTRLGHLVAEFADRSQYGLVENHDNIDFYAGLSSFDMASDMASLRKLPAQLAVWRQRMGSLPVVVALNQAYLPWRWPAPWGRQEIIRRLDRELAPLGYRPWLRRPFPAWVRGGLPRHHFVLEQYHPAGEAVPLPPGRLAWWVDGSRLLRAFRQEVRGGHGATTFRGVEVPAGRWELRAWLSLLAPPRDSSWRLRYRLEVRDQKDRLLAAGRGELGGGRRRARVRLPLDLPATEHLTLVFAWQAPPAGGKTSLLWGEPRLVDPGRPLRGDYGPPRGGRWFSDREILPGSPGPVGLGAARAFWARVWHRLWGAEPR